MERPPRLQSRTEVVTVPGPCQIVIDHAPRCEVPTCGRVVVGSAARPWVNACRHCGHVNRRGAQPAPVTKSAGMLGVGPGDR